MSRLDMILRRAYAPAKMQPDDPPRWALAAAAEEKYRIPGLETVTAQATLYTKLSWIQTAIEIVSQAAATTPFQVKQRRGEQADAIKNHPFEQLLIRPNDLQSRFEFLEATFSFRRLTGAAYWWLNRTRPDEPPEELWLIPTNQIQPVPDENLYLKGYAYDPGDGKKIALEPWEVVQFPTFNPLSRFVGLSAVQCLRLAAVGDVAAQEYNVNFYGRDAAKIAGFLAFADAIDDDRWNQLKRDTAREYGGTKNKRMMMLRNVGKGGVEWIATNMSQADMQYLDQRQFTKEEIFARLAPGLASMLAINANEANARSGDSTLRAFAIYPAQVAVGEKISLDILPSYGENLVGEFDDVRHKDRMLELAEQQEYARTHTIDQINKKYYGEGPLGDPRGDLLPSEIGKGMTDGRAPEDKPPPAAFGLPGPNAQQQPPTTAPGDELLSAGKALDRKRWRTKAMNALARGKDADVVFDPDYLSDGEAMIIRAALKRAASADDIWKALGEG